MTESRRERKEQRRLEREAQNAMLRDAAARRARSKRIINYIIIFLIIAAAGYGLYALVKQDSGPGRYDALAQCLTKKGTTMYGTDWCPHCKAQKALFGKSFKYVNYIDCDANKAACDAAGVQGFPTWTFPKGEPLEGEQKLEILAARVNCTVQ